MQQTVSSRGSVGRVDASDTWKPWLQSHHVHFVICTLFSKHDNLRRMLMLSFQRRNARDFKMLFLCEKKYFLSLRASFPSNPGLNYGSSFLDALPLSALPLLQPTSPTRGSIITVWFWMPTRQSQTLCLILLHHWFKASRRQIFTATNANATQVFVLLQFFKELSTLMWYWRAQQGFSILN